jgi:hypothetical protein
MKILMGSGPTFAEYATYETDIDIDVGRDFPPKLEVSTL